MGLTHTLILCPAALVFGVSIKLCYNAHGHSAVVRHRGGVRQCSVALRLYISPQKAQNQYSARGRGGYRLIRSLTAELAVRLFLVYENHPLCGWF